MVSLTRRGDCLDFLGMIMIYLVCINLLSCVVCIVDKHNAKKGLWRVSEKSLFILSALGGSILMYITMRTIRHKTLHKRFMIGIPLIIVLQLIIVFALIFGIDKFTL